MDKNNINKTSVKAKEGRIDITNNSEKEMVDKAKIVFENFKNKDTIEQLKTDFNFKGNGNRIYELQENMKKNNPENFNKSIQFIQNCIEQSKSLRDNNINNFKSTSIYKPGYYNHKSITATYAKNPLLHQQKYREKLQEFSTTYTNYIKHNIPTIIPVEDDDFC